MGEEAPHEHEQHYSLTYVRTLLRTVLNYVYVFVCITVLLQYKHYVLYSIYAHTSYSRQFYPYVLTYVVVRDKCARITTPKFSTVIT